MVSLEFKNIHKSFFHVPALQDIDLEISSGTICGLIGENGAGKSTFLKILCGDYIADQGSVILNGKEQHFKSPKDAIQAGVSIIHQEPQYISQQSVLENLLAGALPNYLGFVRWKKAKQFAQKALEQINIDLPLQKNLYELSIAERQLVEIAKSIFRNAQVLAFDEPTSSLSSKETENLLKLIRNMKDQGKIIFYVSHRLDEVLEICNACVVFRDGKKVKKFDSLVGVNRDQLISNMVGRDIKDLYSWSERPKNPAKGLQVEGMVGIGMKKPISFSVQAGEILGVFGLVGAGRSEFCRVLYNQKKRLAGKVTLDGETLKASSIAGSIDEGIFLCPEDRKEDGLIALASVSDNINISAARHYLFLKMFRNKKAEKRTAIDFRGKLRIKCAGIEQEVKFLSGGNQQKTILARWLAETNLRLIIMDEPTRGIDVQSRLEIYQILYELARQGSSVLVISSDLPEVLGISDRIMVMCDSQITGILSRQEATEQNVITLALPKH